MGCDVAVGGDFDCYRVEYPGCKGEVRVRDYIDLDGERKDRMVLIDYFGHVQITFDSMDCDGKIKINGSWDNEYIAELRRMIDEAFIISTDRKFRNLFDRVDYPVYIEDNNH